MESRTKIRCVWLEDSNAIGQNAAYNKLFQREDSLMVLKPEWLSGYITQADNTFLLHSLSEDEVLEGLKILMRNQWTFPLQNLSGCYKR